MEPRDNIISIKKKFENSFLYSKETEVQKNLCKYLNVLKQMAYNKLLQDGVTVEERSLLTGELRAIQKLIDTLGIKTGLNIELPE